MGEDQDVSRIAVKLELLLERTAEPQDKETLREAIRLLLGVKPLKCKACGAKME